MKKMLCLIAVLALAISMFVPAFAAEDDFVPSISYKDGPQVEDAVMDGKDVAGCVVVTSIKGAKEKTTDIDQADRDLLLEVYEKLDNGSMKLPLENEGYVVRELVDVSFAKSDCVDTAHGHKEWLAEENATIEVTFDLGIKAATNVEVLAYVNGEWVAVSVKNNGDGTVTCVFEDFCPVAFCVDADAEKDIPQTGDAAGQNLTRWFVLLAVSLLALVALVVNRKKILG